MKNQKICFIFILTLIFLTGLITNSYEQASIKSLDEAPGIDFVRLFNRTDFTGWNIEPDLGAWLVKDWMIYCKGYPREPYLIQTNKEYENFDFYAEFNVEEGCNSGIFFHLPPFTAGRSSRIGFEVQILDDAGKPPTSGSTGAIYDQIPPKMNAMKPAGEWNQYRVTFDYPTCKVWLNGELIQDADFSQFPHLKYRLRRGVIGLSNHGKEIYYRNLWIKELPDTEVWQPLFNGVDLSGWQTIGNADWQVEDGKIVASGDEGYLVTNEDFIDFHFQAYVENDTLQSHTGGFYYRWQSIADPGYMAEFYDYSKAVVCLAEYKNRISDNVIPIWRTVRWLLYQIISTNRESETRVGGYIASQNYLQQKVRPGKIAIYHSPKDGLVRIHKIRIKKLDDEE